MKSFKLFFVAFSALLVFNSCTDEHYYIEEPYYPTLQEIVMDYDLWYIDYHRTTGTGDIPFLSRAFTISFLNGHQVYANNNIVGIGFTGDGYGVDVGYWDADYGELYVDHILDGGYYFDVVVDSYNKIRLVNYEQNVTYYLEGYQSRNFDYDKVFYDNIEYFLQEYEAWEKTYTSLDGEINEFDNENFLAFTPENITTFYSSTDDYGTDVANINWSYVGDYQVKNIIGYDNLKHLTLDYDSYGKEEFELSVINDGEISLYHLSSGTTYEFAGLEFIQYLKSESTKGNVNIESRKRTKVQRESIERQRHLK